MNEHLENELREAYRRKDELETFLVRLEKIATEMLNGKFDFFEYECHALFYSEKHSVPLNSDNQGIWLYVKVFGCHEIHLSTLIEIQKEMGATDIGIDIDSCSRVLYLNIIFPSLSPFKE